MATYYFKIQCKVYNGSTVGSSVNVSQTARSLTISTARDKVIVPSGYELRSSSPYVDTSSPSSTYGKWYNATSLSGYCEAQVPGTAGTCNIYVYVDKHYTITFDANGGKIGNYDSVTRTTNSSGQVTNFPDKPIKDSTATYDYTFDGWYTKKTGGDYIYLDIIGKFKINEWKDKQYAQIEVVDFNKKTRKAIEFQKEVII